MPSSLFAFRFLQRSVWVTLGSQLGLCLLGASLLGSGCRPQIGDDCNSGIDCSQQGDRLCDTTQPNGYCTVFGCQPDSCPDDRDACISFDPRLDPACKQEATIAWARFERSFCLQTCKRDEDCRVDYRCVTPAARGASSVDTDEVDGVKADAVRVCLPELSDASSGASRSTKDVPAVCLPPEELEEDFLASVPTPAGKE